MKLSYKYRIFPTKLQTSKIEEVLEQCRYLFNYYLGERKVSWEVCKHGITCFEQMNELPKLKKVYPAMRSAYSQTLQNVARRVDLGMKAFFRRVKNKETPGFPRFKAKGRYSSFLYPDADCVKLVGGKIRLPKIGDVEIVLHRPIEGKMKTVCVSRGATGKYYLSISCDNISRETLPINDKVVGIDVGICKFAALSDGSSVANPRFFESDQKALAKVQRRAQKMKNYKPTRRVHERIANRRGNFHHQTSARLVKRYGRIVVEDLSVAAMLKKRWVDKQILDAGWSDFLAKLSYKAEYAGRIFERVNPAYTSQICSVCGAKTPHELKDCVFECSCGHREDRDFNAAKNILRLGLQSEA